MSEQDTLRAARLQHFRERYFSTPPDQISDLAAEAMIVVIDQEARANQLAAAALPAEGDRPVGKAKCPACNGTGGGETRMGGPEWTCQVCGGSGTISEPAEGDRPALQEQVRRRDEYIEELRAPEELDALLVKLAESEKQTADLRAQLEQAERDIDAINRKATQYEDDREYNAQLWQDVKTQLEQAQADVVAYKAAWEQTVSLAKLVNAERASDEANAAVAPPETGGSHE
jgi:predicted DNA binding CopG/RHH family protein